MLIESCVMFIRRPEPFKVARRGLDIPIFGILLQLHQ